MYKSPYASLTHMFNKGSCTLHANVFTLWADKPYVWPMRLLTWFPPMGERSMHLSTYVKNNTQNALPLVEIMSTDTWANHMALITSITSFFKFIVKCIFLTKKVGTNTIFILQGASLEVCSFFRDFLDGLTAELELQKPVKIIRMRLNSKDFKILAQLRYFQYLVNLGPFANSHHH